MTEPTDVSLTRRRLLQTGAVASVALLGLDVLEGATVASAGVPAHLRRVSFVQLAGRKLASPVGGLTLDEVADVADVALAGRDDVFVLRLSGPGQPALGQGIAQLSHPDLGGFSMFVVPIDEPSSRQRYEVTVDRSLRLVTAQTDAPVPLGDRLGAAVVPGTPVEPAATKAARTAAKASTPLVLGARLARRAGRLSVDLRVASDRHVVAVRVSLLRADHALARGSRKLDGASVARVVLAHEPNPVGPGRYDLLVTTTDKLGRHASERRPVTLG